MGCNCGGSSSSGEQYQAIAQDGTVQQIETAAGAKMSGTLAEARAKVSTMNGGWVKKAGAAS